MGAYTSIRNFPTLRSQNIKAPEDAVAYYYDHDNNLHFIMTVQGQSDFVTLTAVVKEKNLDPRSLVTLRGLR